MPGVAGQAAQESSGNQQLSSGKGAGWRLTVVCLQIQHEFDRLDATQMTTQ